MQRTINRTVLAVTTVFLMGCGGDCRLVDDELVAGAVSRQMELYPEARLQDLYKSFFQAEFGPEHLISDSASVGKYLDAELTEPDSSAVLFEPIGTDRAFYRVHLRAVQDGIMTRDELLGAFLSSASEADNPKIQAWKRKWHHILDVIEDMNLNLEDFELDRQMIDSILSEGQYAVHHSRHFGQRYKPHYRIVRREFVSDLADQR